MAWPGSMKSMAGPSWLPGKQRPGPRKSMAVPQEIKGWAHDINGWVLGIQWLDPRRPQGITGWVPGNQGLGAGNQEIKSMAEG